MKVSIDNFPPYIGPPCPFCGDNWYETVKWKLKRPKWAFRCQNCKFTSAFYEDALLLNDDFPRALENYNK